METNISNAILLLAIGMVTVFIVLMLVVLCGSLLIKLINKYAPEPKAQPKPVPVPAVIAKKDLNFTFFGASLGFDMPNGLSKAKFYPQDQKGISNFFSTAASSEYEPLIGEIKESATQLNLNDWGVYLLVLKISDTAFANPDDSRLMSWFIFNKLGYAVRVGLASKHVILMHYSTNTLKF